MIWQLLTLLFLFQPDHVRYEGQPFLLFLPRFLHPAPCTAGSQSAQGHPGLIWVDFEDIRGVKISLEGAEYELIAKEKSKKSIWYYQDDEIETDKKKVYRTSKNFYKMS